MYNYFKEVNPHWNNPKFNLKHRSDPDMDSKRLIGDLVNLFLNNRKTPSGNIVKLAACCQTKDANKRWYAKVQVFSPSNEYISSFGITSDYIGASVNWALEAGIEKDIILEHLSISRILAGHIVFPTWYSNPTEKSWDVYPEGISINIQKGGKSGYYDRIDCTLFAIKKWYSNQQSKLFETVEKNRDWFKLFSNFEQYVQFFYLDSLVVGDGIVDLTSYNPETSSYDKILDEDKNVELPQDGENYIKYIKGCEKFILRRQEQINTSQNSESNVSIK